MGWLLLLACAVALATEATELLFKDFVVTYNKQYHTELHRQHAFECFINNLQKIETLNSIPDQKATHGINIFADLCDYDFNIYHNSRAFPESPPRTTSLGSLAIRAAFNRSVDWRALGAVTTVKNQGFCDSGWAFSACAVLEGVNFLKNSELQALSAQALVSCAQNGPQGCNGGSASQALRWVLENGIARADDYSYVSFDGITESCQKRPVVASLSAIVEISNDEYEMAAWIMRHGPLSVAVDASRGWQTYTSGILNICHGKKLDHWVTIVGFTPGFWIVKNSWGTLWGENGYARISRGSDQCGISSLPISVMG